MILFNQINNKNFKLNFRTKFEIWEHNLNYKHFKRNKSTLSILNNYSYYNSPCELYYKQVVCRDLILKYNYNNVMELPSIKKIVINTTSKIYVADKKYMIPALTALEMITGQKLIINKSKKSIATFKIRKGQPIGCKVTLRNPILYSFLYKFIIMILPRSRDFNGLLRQSINNSGHCSISITNVMLFPELENYYEFFETIRAFNVNFGVSVRDRSQAYALYSALQIPWSSDQDIPFQETSFL